MSDQALAQAELVVQYDRPDRGRQREVLLRSRCRRRRRRLRLLARPRLRDRRLRLGRDRSQRRRHAAEEDRDHPHQADRRHLRPDLGHRVPARRLVAGRQPGAERRGRRRGAAGGDRGDQAARRRRTRRQDAARLPLPGRRRARSSACPRVRSRRSDGRRRSLAHSAEATNGMLAQRGRASYTGDRSRDSPDAGAIAIAVLFEAVLEAWQQAQVGSA